MHIPTFSSVGTISVKHRIEIVERHGIRHLGQVKIEKRMNERMNERMKGRVITVTSTPVLVLSKNRILPWLGFVLFGARGEDEGKASR